VTMLHNSDKKLDREKAINHMRIKIYKTYIKLKYNSMNHNCAQGDA
jgi:hypothetical protein